MSDTALPSRSGITIRRATEVGDSWDTLTLHFTDVDPITLPPDGVRTLFLGPKPVQLEIRQGDKTVLSKRLEMPADTKLYYDLDLVPAGLLQRLLGRGPALVLTETSRAYLAPYDPGPVRMITEQIWIGAAESVEALNEVMREIPDHYSEENEEAEGTEHYIPLSRFAKAMGEDSYDHDFLEWGFAKPGDDLETRFKGHSWVAQWAPLVRERMSSEALAATNAFIIMGVDQDPKFGTYRQISKPRDLNVEGGSLKYLGEIEHPSH